MSPLEAGWHELVTEATAGTQYQFKVENNLLVPDPASRFQPSGVHGVSEVIDPKAYEWNDSGWRGRPWNEAVLYELHVGTFSPEGTYADAEKKLEYLADLGVTAVELMPLASFPGRRNWGYDGVLPYAPSANYGRPDDLKYFIDAAHAKHLMVFLDVVYNHFGPEGNYLGAYAPQFFTDRHQTPWGRAINFDGPCSRTVRDFFINNALYWLEEYHFDGLRFDAVHAIADDSQPDILTEIADTVRNTLGADRHVHLVLENERNAARYLRREGDGCARWYNAQWDDDIHHATHVLVTGETDGYYADYARNPAWHFGRCMAEGFSYQGDASEFRNGERRGEPSRDLPPTAFVSFLQNHDQIGNRAFGERIVELANRARGDSRAVKVAMTALLLAPSPPLLFMGEEFAAASPFLFFCDFGPELAAKVTEGRRSEFSRFEQFNSPQALAKIPDPNSEETFFKSKLDWDSVAKAPHCDWLTFYREVLTCRHEKIVPLIKAAVPGAARFTVISPGAVDVLWPLADGRSLRLIANLGLDAVMVEIQPEEELIYTTLKNCDSAWKEMPSLAAAWFLNA